MGAQAPPAGWYQDPGGPGLRYWDGARWTEHVRPLVQNPYQPATPAAGPVAGGPQAGWHPDPSGRYQLRYWDGGAWSEHVGAANGWRGTDPLAGVGTAPMPVVTGPQPVVAAGGYAQPAPQPQQAWGSPPRTSSAGGLKVQYLALIGAAAIIVAAFLPWLDAPGGGGTTSAFDVPITFLFDPTGAGTGGLDVGPVLLFLGIAGGALTFVPAGKAFRRVVGSVTIGGVVLFMSAVLRLVGDLGGDVNPFTIIGVGAYVALAGGILVAAGK